MPGQAYYAIGLNRRGKIQVGHRIGASYDDRTSARQELRASRLDNGEEGMLPQHLLIKAQHLF